MNLFRAGRLYMKQFVIFTVILMISNLYAQPVAGISVSAGLDSPELREVYNFSFVSVNEGWAAGENLKILHTVNGGSDWTVQNYSEGSGITFKNIFFYTSLTGWAVGGNGSIFKTENGGNDWNDLTDTLLTQNNLNAVCQISDSAVLIVRDDGIILKSENGGISFNLQESGTTKTYPMCLHLIHCGLSSPPVTLILFSTPWMAALPGTELPSHRCQF